MLKTPRGTKDVFGNKILIENKVISIIRNIFSLYNLKEIETPIFEKKEVFVKSIGSFTDIVQKQMYLFKDKKGREMVLRPEGTAGVIRSILENKMQNNLPLKFFYQGQMFRYERPQKNRQRQFKQVGIEIIANPKPEIDFEVLKIAKNILDSLKIKFKLEINYLGTGKTIKKYNEVLKKYFSKYKELLSNTSQKRIDQNPIRIFDDKQDCKKDFVKNAPKIFKYFTDAEKNYFEEIQDFLKTFKIDFKINPFLVRGLDYYEGLAFEFISANDTSSQSTIIGGGRYNLKNFNNKFDISGIGFAIGLERLISYLPITLSKSFSKDSLDVFIVQNCKTEKKVMLNLLKTLRNSNLKIDWNYEASNNISKEIKKTFKKNPKIIIICTDKLLKEKFVEVKNYSKIYKISLNKLKEFIKNLLKEKDK